MVSPARLLVPPIPIAMTAAPALSLHPDRFFDAEPSVRRAARALYEEMCGLPLVCPHGHVDPSLLSEDRAFPEPAALLITPDHYLFRMLYSQGVSMESLGVPREIPRRPSSATRERSGASSPPTIICSAVPRRAHGSTTSFTSCSACASASAPTPPIASTIRSTSG